MDILEIPWVVTLIRIAVILAITVLAVLLLRQVEKRRFRHGVGSNEIGRKLFYRIMVVVIYCVGLLTAVSQVQSLKSLVTTLLAGSGIFAVVIGLAAQDGFSNLIGGVLLSAFHPFAVGDKVVLPERNITGVIEDISLRHTVIRTITSTRVIIPNSVMNSAVIENINYADADGVSNWIDVSIAYNADIDLAKSILAEVIYDHPLYFVPGGEKPAENPVQVLLRAMSASGLELRAQMRTRTLDESFGACSDVRQTLVRRFREAGVEIPYNKLDVQLKNQK